MESARQADATLPGPPRQVAEGVWQIELPQPYFGTVSAYLIEDKRLTLVDCGHGANEHLLVEALSMLGHRLENLDLILYTHPHIDHVGGRLTSSRTLNAERFGSDWTLPPMDMVRDFQARPGRHAGRVPALAGTLLSPGAREVLVGYSAYTAPVHVDHILSGGDAIHLGRNRLVAVHTPGHSQDHLVFLEPDRGICFSGDLILGSGPALDACFGDDIDRYLQSLEHVGRMAPTATPLAGHGGPLPLLQEAAANSIARVRRRNQTILSLLNPDWISVPAILERVHGDMVRHSPAIQGSMIGMMLIQLDWLVSHGLAEETSGTDGPLFRTRAGAGRTGAA